MKARENDSRSAEYSSETNYDQEQENSEVTNFLISISPDGRIESIKSNLATAPKEGQATSSRSLRRLCNPGYFLTCMKRRAAHPGGDRLSRRAG